MRGLAFICAAVVLIACEDPPKKNLSPLKPVGPPPPGWSPNKLVEKGAADAGQRTEAPDAGPTELPPAPVSWNENAVEPSAADGDAGFAVLVDTFGGYRGGHFRTSISGDGDGATVQTLAQNAAHLQKGKIERPEPVHAEWPLSRDSVRRLLGRLDEAKAWKLGSVPESAEKLPQD